jgi:hypothetical protein
VCARVDDNCLSGAIFGFGSRKIRGIYTGPSTSMRWLHCVHTVGTL